MLPTVNKIIDAFDWYAGNLMQDYLILPYHKQYSLFFQVLLY